MENELWPYLFSGYLNLHHFNIFRLGHLLPGSIWSISCPYIVCRIGRNISACLYMTLDNWKWLRVLQLWWVISEKIYCYVLHQWMIHGITRQWINTQWVLTRPDSNMIWTNDRTTVPTLGQIWANLHCCFAKMPVCVIEPDTHTRYRALPLAIWWCVIINVTVRKILYVASKAIKI